MSVLRDKRFAVIGVGNIGRILLARLSGAGVPGKQIVVVDAQLERELAAAAALSVQKGSLSEVTISAVNVLLLAAPPRASVEILMSVRDWLQPHQLVLSFAAAVPLDRLEAVVPPGVGVVRIMPNAPSLVGQGMNPVAYGQALSPESRLVVDELLGLLGRSVEVHDRQMADCVGLSGAAMRSLLPALEAMSQAGVEAGLSQREAERMAAQVMLGTAAMVLRSGLSVDQIKALTPMETVDEAKVAHLFYQAVREVTSKIERLEQRLWGEPA